MTNIYKIIKNLKKTYNKYIKNNAVTATFVFIVLFLICVIIWQSVMISKLKNDLNEKIEFIDMMNETKKVDETNIEKIATPSKVDNKKEKKQKAAGGLYSMQFDLQSRDIAFVNTLEMMYLGEASEKHPFNYSSFDRVGTSRYSSLNKMAICGDSYSGYLHDYIASTFNISLPFYGYAGRSVVENEELYNKALDSSAKVVVLSTSVNDVFDQTEPMVFKETIERLFKRAYDNNKIFVIHSNVDFLWDDVHANYKSYVKYVPKYYDAIIKRSAMKYENVIYIDCNDIAVDENRIDSIHYNYNFNKILLDRIDVALFSKLR